MGSQTRDPYQENVGYDGVDALVSLPETLVSPNVLAYFRVAILEMQPESDGEDHVATSEETEEHGVLAVVAPVQLVFDDGLL